MVGRASSSESLSNPSSSAQPDSLVQEAEARRKKMSMAVIHSMVPIRGVAGHCAGTLGTALVIYALRPRVASSCSLSVSRLSVGRLIVRRSGCTVSPTCGFGAYVAVPSPLYTEEDKVRVCSER
uniref:ORF3 protein n=1 Tax=Psittacine aviadenovirus B TaxID=2169709 RepID=A0AB38ZP91_9ADEN